MSRHCKMTTRYQEWTTTYRGELSTPRGHFSEIMFLHGVMPGEQVAHIVLGSWERTPLATFLWTKSRLKKRVPRQYSSWNMLVICFALSSLGHVNTSECIEMVYLRMSLRKAATLNEGGNGQCMRCYTTRDFKNHWNSFLFIYLLIQVSEFSWVATRVPLLLYCYGSYGRLDSVITSTLNPSPPCFPEGD